MSTCRATQCEVVVEVEEAEPEFHEVWGVEIHSSTNTWWKNQSVTAASSNVVTYEMLEQAFNKTYKGTGNS